MEQRGDIEYVTLDTQIKTRQTPTPFAADSYPDALGDVTHSNRMNGHGRLDLGPVQPWQTILVLSLVSALWLVVAVYFLGDISAHFNPATTLAFALRKDMDWIMAGAYWIVQFAAAVCGSPLARRFFGPEGHLAATMPKPGQSWQAAGFEAIITCGLVLMILNLANGPKLNGPFVPLAVDDRLAQSGERQGGHGNQRLVALWVLNSHPSPPLLMSSNTINSARPRGGVCWR